MPEASMAAATVSPSRASTERPSMVMWTVRPSSSLLNMEPPSAEDIEGFGGKRALRDERRQRERVVRGERDAAVAGSDECAGAFGRLVVDREAVARHHAQRRPGAHDVERPDAREHSHRAVGEDRDDRVTDAGVEPRLL